MAKILCNIFTSVAYKAGGVKVVVLPGENSVPDDVLSALMADPDGAKPGDANFQRHVKLGHLVLAADEPAAPPPVAPAADPRARRPKESDKAYTARMAKLDDEAAKSADADRSLVGAYDALSDEEKTAMYDTLDDREKALVDAPRNP